MTFVKFCVLKVTFSVAYGPFSVSHQCQLSDVNSANCIGRLLQWQGVTRNVMSWVVKVTFSTAKE